MPRESELTIAVRLASRSTSSSSPSTRSGQLVRGDAVAGGEELEVLVDAQVVVDAEHVGHVAEPAAHVASVLATGRCRAPRNEPLVGRSSVAIIENVVDLPAPFGPISPKIEPVGTTRSMASTAVSAP